MSKLVEFLNKNIELKSEVVELGLIDDIKSEMKEANRGGMKAIDMANAAKKPAEDSLKLNKELLKKIEKAEKAAKDLGVSDAVKVLEVQKKQVVVNINTLDDILNALYKI